MQVTWFFLAKFTFVNFVMPTFDVVTDIWTAVEFGRNEEILYSFITVMLIFLPVVVNLQDVLIASFLKRVCPNINMKTFKKDLKKYFPACLRLPIFQQIW